MVQSSGESESADGGLDSVHGDVLTSTRTEVRCSVRVARSPCVDVGLHGKLHRGAVAAVAAFFELAPGDEKSLPRPDRSGCIGNYSL